MTDADATYRDVRCPACGERLDGGETSPPDSVRDGELRIAVDCPACGTPLRIDATDFDPRTGDVATSVTRRTE